MIKEKLLKIFLAIPVVRAFTHLFLFLFIRKVPVKDVFGYLRERILSINSEGSVRDVNSKHFEWLIHISAPSGKNAALWGDTYFAHEIAAALRRQGQMAKVVFRDQIIDSKVKPNTVILNLRGLLPLETQKRAINILWIISHPSQILKSELKNYQFTFAASNYWAKKYSQKWKIEIGTLLQATNPEIFNTHNANGHRTDQVLFVGNTRGTFRHSVKTAVKNGISIQVIGSGWEKYIPKSFIKASFIENAELSAAYRSSKYVLNDHWKDMASDGFISNRIFDAVASGARVISDQVEGLSDIFGDLVFQYKDEGALISVLEVDSRVFQPEISKLDELAAAIQKEHNFDVRAKELIKAVQQLPMK